MASPASSLRVFLSIVQASREKKKDRYCLESKLYVNIFGNYPETHTLVICLVQLYFVK